MTVVFETALTAGQAARRLGISTQRLAQLAHAGRVEFVTTPYGRLYEPEEVERLAAERERNGA